MKDAHVPSTTIESEHNYFTYPLPFARNAFAIFQGQILYNTTNFTYPLPFVHNSFAIFQGQYSLNTTTFTYPLPYAHKAFAIFEGQILFILDTVVTEYANATRGVTSPPFIGYYFCNM